LPPESLRRTSLWVVGDGEYRIRLQQQAEALGISQKTRFWGRISNHLLPDFYAAGDLLVVPSIEAKSGDTEGQCVVILEAFAARLCVLATRVGGISDVVDDGDTGVMVETREPKQLAEAITKLLSDSELRDMLANNAFAKVNRCYDWQKIAQDFENLYRAVL